MIYFEQNCRSPLEKMLMNESNRTTEISNLFY